MCVCACVCVCVCVCVRVCDAVCMCVFMQQQPLAGLTFIGELALAFRVLCLLAVDCVKVGYALKVVVLMCVHIACVCVCVCVCLCAAGD